MQRRAETWIEVTRKPARARGSQASKKATKYQHCTRMRASSRVCTLLAARKKVSLRAFPTSYTSVALDSAAKRLAPPSQTRAERGAEALLAKVCLSTCTSFSVQLIW